MRIPVLFLLVLAFPVAALAADDFETRTYDVSSIVSAKTPLVAPILGPIGTHETWDPAMEEGEPRRALSIDTIEELIRQTVDPDSWGNEWAEIHNLYGQILVVKNRPDRLVKVEELLRGLSGATSRRVLLSVDTWELPRERYAEVAGADSARIDWGRLEGTRLESASIEAWPGVRTALKVTGRVRYVGDVNVEIAQGSTIGDPHVQSLEEGLAADFVVHPDLDGKSVLVEAVLQSGRVDRPMREVSLALDEEYFPQPFRSDARSTHGKLQLPTFRHADAVVTRVVPSGGTFLVPLLSEDRCVVFVVTAKVDGGADTGLLVDTGLLSRTPLTRCFGYQAEESDVGTLAISAPRMRPPAAEPVPFDSLDELASMLPGIAEPGTVALAENGFFLVTGTAEDRERVRSFLRKRMSELVHPLTLDLSVRSVATDGGGDSGESLLAGQASTVSGRLASIMTGDTTNFLADYDVEVAQEARIADPIVGQSFAGLVANLRPRLSVDGKSAQVELQLLIAHRAGLEPFQSDAQTVGTVDIVDEKRTVLNSTVVVPVGGATTLDAGPDPRDPSRRLTVVLAVR